MHHALKFVLIFLTFSVGQGKLSEIQRNIFIIEGEKGSGTGFALEVDGQSFICTNQHVLAGQLSFKIQTLKGEVLELGKHVYFPHDNRDLILLETKEKINGFKSSSKISFDEEVYSYGNSAGENVITQKTGKITGIGEKEIEYDNPTVMGDSGSPVLNKNSQIVGVVTRGVKEQKINAWLEDRPDLHTRRFGTRVDNVRWIKSTKKQLLRLSLIYDHVMPIIQKWVNAYNLDIGTFENYISKSKEMVLPLPQVEGEEVYETPWRRGQFLGAREYKFYVSCPRANPYKVTSFGETRTEMSVRKSTDYNAFYNKKSLSHDKGRMLTPIENWYSDFDKFMAIGVGYQYPKIHSYDILRYIFYRNLLSDLLTSYNFIDSLPSNWMTEEMQGEIDLMFELTKNYFPKLEPEQYDILYYFGNRDNFVFGKNGGRFLHQLSNAELLFMVYLDYPLSKRRTPFITKQPIFEFFDYCLDNENAYRSGKSIDATRKLVSKAKQNKYRFIYEHPTANSWRFGSKLEDAVKSAKSNGIFSFLGRVSSSERPYFQYKTYLVIQKEVAEEFKLMNGDFYNEKNYDFRISSVNNIGKLLYSDSETTLFRRLRDLQ